MAEVLNVTPEVDLQSPEYIAEMAAKGEAAVNGGVEPEAPAVIPEKPEGIPDKFYNAETGVVDYQALAKSYVELEKSKGKPADPPKVPDAPVVDDANKAVADTGLDMSTLSKEYDTNGELSEATYAALEAKGISKDTVDSYIEGQTARVEAIRSQAYQITEGDDGYKAMIDYAKANLTPKEISAYNSAINSKDSSVRELAVRGMWSKYTSESGESNTSLVTNKTNTKGGDGGYQSRAEMMADMNDPKYKADGAFRSKVEAKLAKSTIF